MAARSAKFPLSFGGGHFAPRSGGLDQSTGSDNRVVPNVHAWFDEGADVGQECRHGQESEAIGIDSESIGEHARHEGDRCRPLGDLGVGEAFERLVERPDTNLILLDINMPVMSGVDFLRRSKQEDAFTSIPILVISTRGKKQDTELCLEAGAAGYLAKPFEDHALVEQVDALLSPQGARGGSNEGLGS